MIVSALWEIYMIGSPDLIVTLPLEGMVDVARFGLDKAEKESKRK